ncbi:hypothetical protein [Pedobacter antarcticus]|uniref:hypothetical protein n=1 Tax=Pedobacter antarcticus TaxID=34086 RepID=UPI00089231D1|nr:hypothetical protein [Pedobacter antarcticus]SDM14788.1 hypothetical protein SAMN04488084_10469 [Pedobacter antarcticus]
MRKEIRVLIAVCLFFQGNVFGQTAGYENDIKAILDNFILSPKGTVYWAEYPEEKRAFLISILISVDNDGSIGVNYLNTNEMSDYLLNYQKLTAQIQADKNNLFKNSTNTNFLIPVWGKGSGVESIRIGPEFIKNFGKILPENLYQDKSKKVYVLNPLSIQVMKIHLQKRPI